MVDLGPLLCRAAGSRQIDGMDARKDGTHISPGFPPVMWA
jgi:hypothetical protein